MAEEKIEGWQWSWKTAVYSGLVGAILAAIFYLQFSSGKAEAYCLDNPEDNTTCQCLIWINAHTRFWDEFNDSMPDILEIIRNDTYQERLGRTEVAAIINDQLWISNLSPDYNLYYNFEVVPRRCVEARRR